MSSHSRNDDGGTGCAILFAAFGAAAIAFILALNYLTPEPVGASCPIGWHYIHPEWWHVAAYCLGRI